MELFGAKTLIYYLIEHKTSQSDYNFFESPLCTPKVQSPIEFIFFVLNYSTVALIKMRHL
jgi:hypothetical protein